MPSCRRTSCSILMPMSVISRETSEDIIEAMVAARNRIVPSQSSLKTTYSNSGRSNWRRLTDSLTFLSRLRRAKQYRLKENMIKRRWALITTVVRIAMRISADSSLERPRDPSVGGDSDCCCPSDIDTNDSLFSIRNSGVNRVGAGNDSGHCGRTNAYQVTLKI